MTVSDLIHLSYDGGMLYAGREINDTFDLGTASSDGGGW